MSRQGQYTRLTSHSHQSTLCVCAATLPLPVCVQEYGGLEFAPEEIKARIVEMEQLSMTEVYTLTQYTLYYYCWYLGVLGRPLSLQIPQSLTCDL